MAQILTTKELTTKWFHILGFLWVGCCSKLEILKVNFKMLYILATQAGTYVKEFVHGDFARTRPNLRDLLDCDVDIIALDVEVRSTTAN